MHDQSSAIPPIGVAPAIPRQGAPDAVVPVRPVLYHEEISVVALDVSLTAPRWARRHTADVLNRWGLAEISPAVCLTVSELITNAVQAVDSVPEGVMPPRLRLVRLTLRLHLRHLTVEVFDADSRLPEPRNPAADDEGGRGLWIAAAEAGRIGVTPVPDGGKVVWAEFNRPRPGRRVTVTENTDVEGPAQTTL